MNTHHSVDSDTATTVPTIADTPTPREAFEPNAEPLHARRHEVMSKTWLPVFAGTFRVNQRGDQ